MRAFVWRDGERTIRFGEGAAEHAWTGADILTTVRGEPDIPLSILEGARVHRVPSGQVPDAAAALIDRVGDGRMVAWGGGRVIDTAKALAAARGGQVCAVPTTLSGAEMSRGHRPAPGYEGRPNHRPVLVLAEPALMAGQPPEARRASAMNALAHAAEALYGPGRNPVASLAAARAATLLARGVEAGDQDDLALGALLAGYALGSAGFSLHHVLCQTVVRTCGTSHSVTNAAVLPWALDAMAGREPAAIGELAAALGVDSDGVGERVLSLAGAARLRGEGVDEADLPRVADAALERAELDALSPPLDRDELVAILRRAL
ncbi:MAG TPA: iron-containing alcohol dehydrogenase [Gaiellales bacterium]|nr:iron-containing alcohol dehydrogenase [Gaiellales bacterium]